MDIGGQYAKRILAQFNVLKDPGRIRELVDFLVDGCPDHGYVIDYDLAKLFLDNVLTSEEAFGKEYASILSDISTIMIEEDEIEHIGFIAEEKMPEEEVKTDILKDIIEVNDLAPIQVNGLETV